MLVEVTAKPAKPNKPLHQLDQEELKNIMGPHYYKVECVNNALDAYHEDIPIKILEDFIITATHLPQKQ